MTGQPSCRCGVRRFELLRLHHGELSGSAKDDLTAKVSACAACRETLATFEADNQAFLDTVNVAAESARILERLDAAEAKPAAWWQRFMPIVAPAMALLLAIVFLPSQFSSLYQDAAPGPNRTKGAVAIEMFVDDADGAFQAEPGIELREGDRVQFRYRADGHGWLMLVSVDGRGAITLLYPVDGEESGSVDPAGIHPLPSSVILDDAIGTERVYAVFSDEPIAFELVEQVLSLQLEDDDLDDGVALELVDDFEQDTSQAMFVFEKVAP